ncbi:MAG: sigma-70 family RNA polymerase sigma factor [Deltaproteobacteria bacterium]|nr:sigma-70 family RNA polymerase sigma factor [Deltaproteobacteria bacterium]
MVSRAQPDLSDPLDGQPAGDTHVAGAGTGADDADAPTTLVNALLKGETGAPAELFDRYSVDVHRVLVRIIGSNDPEISDLLHDAFLRALDNIHKLKKPGALKSWLRQIAVFTAQEWIRERRRMGHPQSPDSTPERAGVSPTPEARAAIAAFYAVMDGFPADERATFILRFVEGGALRPAARNRPRLSQPY